MNFIKEVKTININQKYFENFMKKISVKLLSIITLFAILNGCARDLSSNVYSSDSTLNLVLEGKVMASRPVIIRDTDKLTDNTAGIFAGGVAGGALGNTAGDGSGHIAMIAGGVLAGAIIGSIIESNLSKADGIEYIVKVDTSKLKDGYYEGSAVMRNAISTATTSGLVTIIQAKDTSFNIGQEVYIIFSPKRTRVIAK